MLMNCIEILNFGCETETSIFGSSKYQFYKIPLCFHLVLFNSRELCHALLQSGILKGFSNELPNSNCMNGGITRNWSKLFMILLVNITEL